MRSAAPDHKAALERSEYLIVRYGAPADKVDAMVAGMDIPTQTLLAIEMNDRRGALYTSDYDPFGAM